VADPLPGAKRASEQGERFRSAIEKIRSRSDTTAKGLAAIGVAAVTAIGYARFADVFPYGGPVWALACLFVGVVLMIVAVVYLVYRFNDAGQSIVTSADAEETIALNSFDQKEKQVVRKSYRRIAKLNGVESLKAYQARAHRFERIAERRDEKQAAALRARADLIMSEVLATQDRAGALVLRRRSQRSVFGLGTLLGLLLFVGGWYGTALAADALESKRIKEVEVAKTCAEARGQIKVVESELPSICGEFESGGEEPSAASVANAAVTALATARAECREKVEEVEGDFAVCRSVELALAAAVGEG
jgi:hypothetical protein